MKRPCLRSLPAIAAGLFLSGCTTEPAGGPLRIEVASANGAKVLGAVNELAQKCWIRSGDREFRQLSVIPELDTRTGKPRLLIVERGKSSGLPKLVVEADENPVRITTYGPLASAPVSNRINRDVSAWASGRSAC